MTQGKSELPADTSEEISSLIETLHKTGQRLEELTAGQVDTVTNRAGQMFVLQPAQEQLRHIQAAKQAAILNALPAHIAVLDAQGIIISTNEAWRAFYDSNAGDSLGGQNGLNYVETCERTRGDCPAGAHQVAAGIRAVLSREIKSFSIEYPCHSPTEQHWFLAIVTPLGDERSGGAVVMHVDITQRKQDAEALVESGLRFRQIAENIHDVFFLQSLDGSQIYYVSPAYEQIWGRTCESLYADPKSWAASIHPDDLGDAFTHVNKFQTSDFDYEFRIIRPDGGIRWIYLRGFPILDEAGNAYRTACIASDVTQRRQASEQLHESERRFSDLLRNVELVSVMLDREARITFCNEYLLHLTGWTSKEVIGRNWFKLFIPPELENMTIVFASVLAGAPEAGHHENEILTRSGERRLIRWNNSVLRSGAGDVVGSASIGEDITEQKRAEIRIKRLNHVYVVLSQTNALIARAQKRDELFREVTRIAVAHGQFRMAWIGVVDKEVGVVKPTAFAGDIGDFFDSVPLALIETMPGGRSLVGRAVREMTAKISNDVPNDPQLIMKKQLAERGINSLAIIPLMFADEAIGILCLYSTEAGFFDDEEVGLLTGLGADISFAIDHINKQERLDYLAYYDSLTGLPNRTLFLETLKKTLALSSDSGGLVAVLCIDLDFFKDVNDRLGHAIGDELLRQFGSRLVKCTRPQDTVGRLSGDVFALIIMIRDSQESAILVNTIRDALREPFDLKDHQVSVTASLGISLHPDDACDPDTLMKYADTAMQRAKQAGRDTFRFFTAQMNAEVVARLDLEAALRKAVVNDEFVLYYQPKVDLKSGRISGMEGLLRWQRPGHGLILPHVFIAVLESTGLIVRVGKWVVDEACRQIALWSRSSIGPVQVSVNVSARQFIEGDLLGDVVKALGDSEISGDLLELELTESSLIANVGKTVSCLQSLKNLGVQISVDDFGTGYSSLAYLRRFPIDKLKIDIAFIRDVTSNPDDASIVQAIIRMAHSLKLEVIAEGVETAGQLAYLRRHGCDCFQGYYFSPAMPAAQAEQMLRDEKRLPLEDDDSKTRETLLLVDDDAGVLSSLQRLFRHDGYHILSSQSAAEAFELLALHPVQVILCDQRMPGMNGTAFLDRVKDLYPTTLRIILSGYTDLESIIDAINRGAIYRFFTKPWDNKLLRNNISEAFRHYRLLHPHSEEGGAETRAGTTSVHALSAPGIPAP